MRKPKRVRCWLVTYGDGTTDIKLDNIKLEFIGIVFPKTTITPGYFVPDEPKKKRKETP